MKRIIEFFKQKDKQLHLAACLLIAFFVGLFNIIIFNGNGWSSATIGFTVAMVIGFLKEGIDEIFRNGYDIKDLIADFIGAIVGLLLIGIIF